MTHSGSFRFPTVPEGAPITVSATLFTTYLRCPDEARGRLEGAYPEDTVASFKGVLAHRIFARHLTEGVLAPEAFEQSCREEIGKSLNPKLGSLGLKPSRLQALVREVGDLYERFTRFPSAGFRGAEVTVDHEPSAGVVLRGVVDAVFDMPGGGVRLVDWKTGNLGGAAPQLDFYALVWALHHEEIPIEVEAASVGTGERYTRHPTRKSLEATALQVAALVAVARRAFAAGTFLPKVGGPWCRHCALLAECPEGSAAVKISP